jgi:hypothetical protein
MGSSTITEIAKYNNDVVDSLKLHFRELSPNFIGRSREEIATERGRSLQSIPVNLSVSKRKCEGGQKCALERRYFRDVEKELIRTDS